MLHRWWTMLFKSSSSTSLGSSSGLAKKTRKMPPRLISFAPDAIPPFRLLARFSSEKRPILPVLYDVKPLSLSLIRTYCSPNVLRVGAELQRAMFVLWLCRTKYSIDWEGRSKRRLRGMLPSWRLDQQDRKRVNNVSRTNLPTI